MGWGGGNRDLITRSQICESIFLLLYQRGAGGVGRGRVGDGKGVKDGLGWGQQRPHHSESDL